MHRPYVCLLGPQRFHPTVEGALQARQSAGPIAVVTAGWQEREGEDQEFRDHVGRPVVNLSLYDHAEGVFRDDPELFEALRARQDRLRAVQRLYRTRLDHAMAAVRAMHASRAEPWAIDPERDDAAEAVRALDAHHRDRLADIHRSFEDEWRPTARDAVARRRESIAQALEGVGVLAIAGGHVAILQNRLRLFDVLSIRPELPIVAWSAGAMVLGERVFAFHDSPPQGAGNAELLDIGLEAIRGVVSLPHASRRLRLDDPVRVSILARRAAPDLAVALDGGSRLWSTGTGWSGAPGTIRLSEDGGMTEVGTR